MTAEHITAGAKAEQAAAEFLLDKGCHILVRNYVPNGRDHRQGELDLIIMDEQVLAFVEVRYRRNHNFGGALESITLKKQQLIKATAERFLQQHPDLMFKGCRFDVIAVTGMPGDLSVEHIKSAF